MKRTIVLVVALLVLGPLLWTFAALKFVYASGERAGYMQKFSKKGWVFKTWEGELAMVNLPGAMPEIFKFTVRDDKTAGFIQQSMGQRVTLHYEYHPGLPGNIFGDTAYFVTQVQAITAPDPTKPLP